MLLVLTLSLLIVLCSVYAVFDKDLLSPTLVATGSFFVSTLGALIYSHKWLIDINSRTVFLILLGLVPIFIGELITRSYCNKIFGMVPLERQCLPSHCFLVSRWWCFVSFVIMLTICIYSYNSVQQVYMNFQLHDTLIGNYRRALGSDNLQRSSIAILADTLSLVIGYLFSYAFLKKILECRKVLYIYLPIIGLYILNITLSGARIGFIFYLSFLLTVSYITIKNRQEWSHAYGWRFMFTVLFCCLSGAIIFYCLGFLTGKTFGMDLFEYIAIYGSGSIPALDEWLKIHTYDVSNLGSTTLFGLSNLLQRLGYEGFSTQRNLDFIAFGNAGRVTNVYSAYGRLLHDYGIYGMLGIRFIMAALYTVVYMNIKYNRYGINEDRNIILYSIFFHPFFMQAVDETFFKNLLALSIVFEIVIIFFIYSILRAHWEANNYIFETIE
jgi:oligosaccharide repeat unit polymerase